MANHADKSSLLSTAIIDMQDYVQINGKQFPELINYIGFAQDDQLDDDKICGEPLYEEHLSTSDCILGIK